MNEKIRPFVALIRRELWEHTALYRVPVLIGLLMTALILYGVIAGLASDLPQQEIAWHFDRSIARAEPHAGGITGVVVSAYFANAALFFLVLMAVLFFYALDALYSDRRDRSVLFWKSLPVSDLETVLSKFVTAVFVAPLVTVAIVMAANALWSLIAAAFLAGLGAERWATILSPVAYVVGLVKLTGAALAASLVLMPVLAWLLLASAWATRAPFLWATVPPFTAMLLEEWFFDTNYVLRFIAVPFEALPQLLEIDTNTGISIGTRIRIGGGVEIAIDPGYFLTLPFWVGVAMTMLFLAGAVWLRRHRSEV
ncbi:MAG TPA: ABC-2 transporter permease [Gammaproteobacteria bacterium]|nr:ABC-2 transporter permease [Gammaproteobacteria bacterium]